MWAPHTHTHHTNKQTTHTHTSTNNTHPPATTQPAVSKGRKLPGNRCGVASPKKTKTNTGARAHTHTHTHTHTNSRSSRLCWCNPLQNSMSFHCNMCKCCFWAWVDAASASASVPPLAPDHLQRPGPPGRQSLPAWGPPNPHLSSGFPLKDPGATQTRRAGPKGPLANHTHPDYRSSGFPLKDPGGSASTPVRCGAKSRLLPLVCRAGRASPPPPSPPPRCAVRYNSA